MERIRSQEVKKREAVDIVFAVVKGLLADGKRVLNQNNARSSAIQLNNLVTILETEHGMKLEGKSKRAKCRVLHRYLDILTSTADGRLDYRPTDKNGHGNGEQGHERCNAVRTPTHIHERSLWTDTTLGWSDPTGVSWMFKAHWKWAPAPSRSGVLKAQIAAFAVAKLSALPQGSPARAP